MKRFYGNFVKRTLLSMLIVHLSLLSFAATYYVSSTGNDANSGLTVALAWKTLAKVNAATFIAGDQILFQKGDTFYGSLIVKNSGSSSNPITFGAYGTGVNPIITGFTTITAWTNLGGNIWESTNAVSTLSTCNMVVINGVNTAMGRYPNMDAKGGYLLFQTHSGGISITSSSLTGTPNWTGAELFLRNNESLFNRLPITSQSGGTLTFAYSENVENNISNGFGFFIQNDVRTLDSQNEWYYNPSTKKIRIFSSAQPSNVKIAAVDNLIKIDGSYLSISNFSLTGSNVCGINCTAYGKKFINIQNVNISLSGSDGISLRSAHSTIDNCTIIDSNTNGITLLDGSDYSSVKNSTIQNSGVLLGMGSLTLANKKNIGIFVDQASNSNNSFVAENNRIINTGFNGISFYSDSTFIKNNYIDTFCTLLDDGSGVYTWGDLGRTKMQIDGNIILNGKGNTNGTTMSKTLTHGIYLDDNAINVEIINNTISNCSNSGVIFHNAKNCKLINNLLYNNIQDQFVTWDDASGGAIEGNTITNNKFISKTATQPTATYFTNDLGVSGSILNIGTFYNNCYARPIDDNLSIVISTTKSSLNTWKTFSGQDANSIKSPQAITSITDLQFEYNDTKASRTVTLSQPMMDMKGTKYSGSITLQPFTSLVLMKDLTPVVVPGAPTSLVATAGNASASVTFVAPANNGGSAITGYTVTSVPAGGVDSNAGSTSLTHAITGLTNGTPYTFTVKATNSAGASVASLASNSVIPKAPVATSFVFTGPSTGNVNSASATFTVTPNNTYTGTITLTPSGAGSVGLSSKVLTFTNSSIAQTFTITPTVAGSITLTPTNSGSLTNPVPITYTTNAVVPGAPTSVVAFAGNASASVTFVAPANNGGSAITGYTVTSVPAGGIDSNAGSTSLTHAITGLTNGTSYTFTVKATNSAGASVASVASNSVIPKVPVATNFVFTGPSTGSVNSTSATFTVTPNNTYTGTITLTPSGAGSVGLSAKVLTFSNSSVAQTFTITPTVAGSITLTPTNNGSLTNPANITYTTNAVVPGAPTSVVAVAGNASATVNFVAPTNNGGSAITGYTVTSVPAGGIDSNAGSTSLTHTITGLTNGTSYTFTVKATNSAGTSVASAASNSIIPVEVVVIKQGDITPSHFTTVWQGLNGLNHMNIIVASATMEDFPLSVGDEIAVFSGSACVGTAKLTKSIVPTDNTSFLTILASQSDGSTNGFIENDTILFKVWDNTNKVEKLINGAVYRNDVATWKTTGRYVPGSTSMVEITSYPIYTQSIELLKGYNMISTYVSAPDPSASVVTKTLVDQGNLIKMQDETGNSFENWGDFGGWINQLGALEKTEGYKIQVANNCTLQVTGRPIAMPLNISLKTGWNIISYPRTDVVSAMNVVQALIDQNKLVKVQDEAGNSIENWGLFGGWKNGIGNFIPGKAYKVKMSADAVLAFLESYPKSAVVMAHSEPTEYYHSSLEGHGTDHMNINITDLNSIGISVGDELAAFDGAVCVATTKITEANLLIGSACLVSSFSTDNQNSNGFKVGDPIQITVWSKLSGDESKVTTEVLNGQMKYEKNASVLVKMKSATVATGIIGLDDVMKIDVFPNPSQGQVTVRFSEIPEANSRIEISDMSGRKLISRLVTGTSEEFNLDSFTPGLYLVRSILGKSEHIDKLIVK